jgi:hypothetical protein
MNQIFIFKNRANLCYTPIVSMAQWFNVQPCTGVQGVILAFGTCTRHRDCKPPQASPMTKQVLDTGSLQGETGLLLQP